MTNEHDHQWRDWVYVPLFLGWLASGLAFFACMLIVAFVRIPEFLDAPIGFKNRPLEGLPALADWIATPTCLVWGLISIVGWAVMKYEEKHPASKMR